MQKGGKHMETTEKKTLPFSSALIAVAVSLGTIIVGKLFLSLNTTIVLLLSAKH